MQSARRIILWCTLLVGFSAEGGPPLRLDPNVDIPLTAGATLTWSALTLLSGEFAPDQCKWCDTDSSGTKSLNGLDNVFRSALLWSNPSAAAVLSDLSAFALVPIAGFGGLALGSENWTEFGKDSLAVVEAVAITGILTQLLKFGFGRQRPYAHFATAAIDDQANLSFISGHTSFAFSLAVSASVIAHQREYPLAGWITGAGLTLATTTAYFRIAADKHYLTDVLGGALVGVGLGYLIPVLLHGGTGKSAYDARVSVAPNAVALFLPL